MTKKKYKRLLETQEWNTKREEILKRDKYTCCRCRKYNLELHVHHFYYIEGKKPWEYPNTALVTLCFLCHQAVHSEKVIEVKKVIKVIKPKLKKKNTNKKLNMSKRDKALQKRYNSLKKK